MPDRVQVLEVAADQIQAALVQAEAREAELAELLTKTREHWQAWDARWQGILAMFETRARELEAAPQRAGEVVTAAELPLHDTEAALRAWLGRATALAESLKTPTDG